MTETSVAPAATTPGRVGGHLGPGLGEGLGGRGDHVAGHQAAVVGQQPRAMGAPIWPRPIHPTFSGASISGG